jgi:hypothetical protein
MQLSNKYDTHSTFNLKAHTFMVRVKTPSASSLPIQVAIKLDISQHTAQER